MKLLPRIPAVLAISLVKDKFRRANKCEHPEQKVGQRIDAIDGGLKENEAASSREPRAADAARARRRDD
jgi:hypothetical protein